MVKLKKFYDVEATDIGSSAPGPQVNDLQEGTPVQDATPAPTDEAPALEEVPDATVTPDTPTDAAPVEEASADVPTNPADETPKEEESFLEKVEDKIEEIVEEVKEFFEGDDKDKSNDELDAPAE